MAMACCGDHAAGLVTGDHAGRPLDATRDDATRIGRGAVVVQIAAAHARGLDLEDHVARAGCRIGEPSQLQLAISEKHDAFHGPPPVRAVRRAQMTRAWTHKRGLWPNVRCWGEPDTP